MMMNKAPSANSTARSHRSIDTTRQSDNPDATLRRAAFLVTSALVATSVIAFVINVSSSFTHALLATTAVAIFLLAVKGRTSPRGRSLSVDNIADTTWVGLTVAGALVGLGTAGLIGLSIQSIALIVTIAKSKAQGRLIYIAVAMSPFLLEILAGSSDTNTILSAALLLCTLILGASSIWSAHFIAVATAKATSAYLGLCVALYILGVRAGYSSSYLAGSETSFGPFGERWRFPLSQTWVTAPMLGAVAVALGVYLLFARASTEPHPKSQRTTHQLRWLAVLAIILGLFVLIASNGRTLIASLILITVVASGLLGRAATLMIVLSSQAALLAPIWWPSFIATSGTTLLTLAPSFVPVRDGNLMGLLTIEGRTDIWSIASTAFAQSPPKLFMLGWGPDGYIPSGAAMAYRYVLGIDYAAGNYPPHNASLEVALSTGLIGILLFGVLYSALLWRGVQPLIRGQRNWRLGALAAVLFPAFAVTEVAILPSNVSAASAIGVLAALLALSSSQESRAREFYSRTTRAEQ